MFPFSRRVTATPSECLIVMRRGMAVNKGNGASTRVWPWDSYVLVPTGAIEHGFQMHQETSDGITLRFKGIVIYRIVDPERAATLFRFQEPGDVAGLSQALADVCLGELRAIVAGMSMEQCLSRRKTVLTAHLQDNVLPSIEGRDGSPGWGLKVDVLQVAQVFCPDEALLAQIQAEARDRIRQGAQASEIETARALQLARLESSREVEGRRVALEADQLDDKRALEQKRLATESALKVAELESREVHEERRIATESRLRALEHEQERTRRQRHIEAESALRMLQLQRQVEVAEQKLRLRELEARIAEITTRVEAHRERTMMEIRKEILPLEQLPQISQGLSGLFKDARLSLYGDAATQGLVGPASQLVGMLFEQVRDGCKAPPSPADGGAAPR